MTEQLPGEEHDSPATVGCWPLSSMSVDDVIACESGGVGVGDGVGEPDVADKVGETDGDGDDTEGDATEGDDTEGDRVLVACVPLLAAQWPGEEFAVSAAAAAPIVRAATAAEAISRAGRRQRGRADTGDASDWVEEGAGPRGSAQPWPRE